MLGEKGEERTREEGRKRRKKDEKGREGGKRKRRRKRKWRRWRWRKKISIQIQRRDWWFGSGRWCMEVG